MAKGGSWKLSKLKCMIKRWNSSGRITRGGGGEGDGGGGGASPRSREEAEEGRNKSAPFHGDEVPPGLHPVHVGKSRRRYLVSTGLVGHPLFRVLIDRCGEGSAAATSATVLGCEVVLFEHLLWMLDNADPPPESLDELVEFYAC